MLGCKLKKNFFAQFCLNFLAFGYIFVQKTWKKAYFDQCLECAAPKRWLKYTTMVTKKLKKLANLSTLTKLRYILSLATKKPSWSKLRQILTWKKFWFVGRELAMRQHQTLKSDGKLHVTGPHHVLDFELFEFCRKSQFLNDSGILASGEPGVLFWLGPRTNHLARAED